VFSTLFKIYSPILWKALTGKYRHVRAIPPKTKSEFYKLFGKFIYRNLDNGFVEITDNWETNNIVEVTLPITNSIKHNHWNIRCHKILEQEIFNLFADYVAKGYEKSYPIKQLGCFVPRHKMSDPNKSLSIHSWGAAIDINWKTNRIGTRGDMPVDVIVLFKQYGFNWGGLWTRPKDPMHFEFYSGS